MQRRLLVFSVLLTLAGVTANGALGAALVTAYRAAAPPVLMMALVEWAKMRPAPPVAMTTASAVNAWNPPRIMS